MVIGKSSRIHKQGGMSVISSVSGGSVLAALYCSEPGDFSDFERKVREALTRGFVWPALMTALTTSEGLKAVVAVSLLAVDRLTALVVRLILKVSRIPIGRNCKWLSRSPLRRYASRTTILRRTFSELFGGRKLPELRLDRPRLIIVACELRAKAAFYFTAERLHCWRYGSADSSNVEIAHAVTASASYQPHDRPTFVTKATMSDRPTHHRLPVPSPAIHANQNRRHDIV